MSEKKSIAVEYSTPKLSRRVIAVIIDGACLLLTALALFAGLFAGTTHLPIYENAQKTVEKVQLDSSLYVATEKGTTLISDYLADDTTSLPEDINARLSQALDTFFSDDNHLFFTDDEGIIFYNRERASRADLFTTDPEAPDNSIARLHPLKSASQDALKTFYVDAIEKSEGFLARNRDYTSASKTIFWSSFLTGIISYLISYLIYFLAVPLIARRGFKTIGMMVMKYARVYVDGLNMTAGRFLLRFIYAFLTEGLGFVALFIPVGISIGMTIYGKFNQSLPDYLANTYTVDTQDSSIYFTPQEYAEALASGAVIVAPADKTPEQRESERRDEER